MKKIVYLIVFFTSILLFSCTPQEDDIFDESSSSRIDAALKSHQEVLKSAENGWLMEYFPAAGQVYGGYNLLASFTDDAAKFAGEIALSTETTTGLYSLKQSAGPVLTFDTYNDIFHFFSNPNSSVSEVGTDGVGMGGDFEFLVIKATQDSIILKGKKTENKIVMTPLAADVVWSDFIDNINNAAEEMAFRKFEYQVNGKSIVATVNYRTLNFTYTDEAGNEVKEKASYIQTTTGYKLYKPINIEGVTVSEFIYNKESDDFVAKGNTDVKLIPIIPPLNEQLVSADWYFSFSGLGSFGKTYWNHANVNGIKPIGEELYYAYMGTDAGGYGFQFASLAGTSLYGGALFFDYTLVGEDKITYNFALRGAGDGVWYYNNALFNYILHPITGPRTFTLTTDDVKNPTWIKLADEADPNNTIILESTPVIFPFDN